MNHKRKKAKLKSRNACSYTQKGSRKGEATPAYWDMLYHHRPRRRRDKAACLTVKQGDDPDAKIWDLGNHKPHNYYW